MSSMAIWLAATAAVSGAVGYALGARVWADASARSTSADMLMNRAEMVVTNAALGEAVKMLAENDRVDELRDRVNTRLDELDSEINRYGVGDVDGPFVDEVSQR